MQNPLNQSSSVGQLARAFPATIAVFEEFDVDYACRGGGSVSDAARAAGFEPSVLMSALGAVIANGAAPEPRVSDLVHTIVTEHHRFEGGRFRKLAARFDTLEMPNVDAARIRTILIDLAETVSAHMLREERTLFPHAEKLDLHPHRILAGSISRPMLNEFVEHNIVHERMAKIRELTLRLRARPDADTELLDEVDELYRVVHRHIHLENNVLIPLVIDLENRLKVARSAEATA